MTELVELVQALAWPVVALIAIAVLSLPPGRTLLKDLLGRISSVHGGGFGIELTAKKSSQAKHNLGGKIREFRNPIKQIFDHQAKVERIRQCVERACTEVVDDCLIAPSKGYQATVYVADVLFEGLLYRLIDYYPRGGGAGTVYSIRFGIIGIAWRMEKSLKETVPADQKLLIERWGMTIADTKKSGRSGKTFVCITLRDSVNTQVGLLFVQSETENAFSDDIIVRLEKSPAVAALSQGVDKLVRKLDEAAQAPISIFSD